LMICSNAMFDYNDRYQLPNPMPRTPVLISSNAHFPLSSRAPLFRDCAAGLSSAP
jgi:hypothetical protein